MNALTLTNGYNTSCDVLNEEETASLPDYGWLTDATILQGLVDAAQAFINGRVSGAVLHVELSEFMQKVGRAMPEIEADDDDDPECVNDEDAAYDAWKDDHM